MQKILTILFFVLFASTIAISQPGELSTPLSFQYILDNPAAAGLDGKHHIMLGAYQKWLNLDDAPRTFYLSTSHTLINRSFGIGGTIVQDQAALLKSTRANLNLALHLNPKSAHRFSIGATARYQNISFDAPNVPDPLLANSPSGSVINLGFGLNYHYYKKKGILLNIQLQSPLLPASLEITKSDIDSALTYTIEQALVFQTNLRYPIGGNNYLTPSLRFQGQLGAEGGLQKSQLIDIGLGLSFMEDVLNVRLGYRSGAASMFYGGVGFTFGQGSSAHLLYEPTAPFGGSAAITADFVLGKEVAIKDSLDNERKNEKTVRKQPCFKDTECLIKRWAFFNQNKAFEIFSSSTDDSEFTRITISFNDAINDYFNLFDHQDFIDIFPLNQLASAIQKLYIDDLESKGHNIVQMTVNVKARNNLSTDSYEDYSGRPIQLDYWQNGKSPTEEMIINGASLTEAQLAALKAHFLAGELQKRIPALSSSTIRKEVDFDSTLFRNRKIEIVLIIR